MTQHHPAGLCRPWWRAYFGKEERTWSEKRHIVSEGGRCDRPTGGFGVVSTSVHSLECSSKPPLSLTLPPLSPNDSLHSTRTHHPSPSKRRHTHQRETLQSSPQKLLDRFAQLALLLVGCNLRRLLRLLLWAAELRFELPPSLLGL